MRIIVDTDLGDDIDDSFALGYLLKKAKKDIKLVLSCYGRTDRRAAIIASQLTRSGASHIPVAMGVKDEKIRLPYMDKFCDFDIKSYPEFYENGIEKALEIIKEDVDNTVIIALGPATNLAKMAEAEPELMKRVRVIAMFGSVYKGYFGADKPEREYNVFIDTPSSKKMINSLGNLTIAPLDTCSLIQIKDDRFEKLKSSDDIIVKAFMEDFEKWLTLGYYKGENSTSILYDTLPVYILTDGSELNFKALPLTVTDNGEITLKEKGNNVNCALSWRNYAEFENALFEAYIS